MLSGHGMGDGDRRRSRHDETVALIVQEAWRLAEENGLTAVSVGDLARAMEMRPQSLYTYFASKHAIYDRMYREGFEELLARFADLDQAGDGEAADDPTAFLARAAETFVDFVAERASRYQLLFQRVVPGFEPTTESYAVAIRALEIMRGWLRRAGITAERDLYLWRSLLLGLAGEQLANDPGGRRWHNLAGDAARYFVLFTRSMKESTS